MTKKQKMIHLPKNAAAVGIDPEASYGEKAVNLRLKKGNPQKLPDLSTMNMIQVINHNLINIISILKTYFF